MQDAVKRRDQYKVRIAVEDGGKIYGGNGFEKDGNGTADHIKMDIAGGSDAPETGTWDSKTVPVAACTGCEGGTHNGRSCGRQTVRGIPYRHMTCKASDTNEKCPFSLYSSVGIETCRFRRGYKGRRTETKSKQNNSKRKMTSHFI